MRQCSHRASRNGWRRRAGDAAVSSRMLAAATVCESGFSAPQEAGAASEFVRLLSPQRAVLRHREPLRASFQKGVHDALRRSPFCAAGRVARCSRVANRITDRQVSHLAWQRTRSRSIRDARPRADGDQSARIVGAGQLDAGDAGARVSAYAQARTQAPSEMVYLTSLALACLEPVQPRWPECDATDRLADWATRDVDNGVPMLLLADRARQRNNAPQMAAFLDEAAVRPRFDDYWARGALLLWEEVRALPVPLTRGPRRLRGCLWFRAATVRDHAIRRVPAMSRRRERATGAMGGHGAAQRARRGRAHSRAPCRAQRQAGRRRRQRCNDSSKPRLRSNARSRQSIAVRSSPPIPRTGARRRRMGERLVRTPNCEVAACAGARPRRQKLKHCTVAAPAAAAMRHRPSGCVALVQRDTTVSSGSTGATAVSPRLR